MRPRGAARLERFRASSRTGLALALGVTLVSGWGRGPVWAASTQVSGSGPTAGCASSAFDSRTHSPLLPVALVESTVLSAVLPHPCPGPIYVEALVNVLVSPTALDNGGIFGQAALTCAGNGCAVTGTPITPGPVGVTFSLVDQGQPPEFVSVPVIAVFPDVPRGTYIVDIVLFGLHAELASAQVHAVGTGTASAAGRAPEP